MTRLLLILPIVLGILATTSGAANARPMHRHRMMHHRMMHYKMMRHHMMHRM